ncbi:FxsA family protein, partial [Vibrio cholerae]|nr:FxsA family protein [Vibrio cholerae]
MFPILLFLFIAVPVIEIALFIQVGGVLGVWPTIALVLLTAIVGAS